jgi:hypothetical protein
VSLAWEIARCPYFQAYDAGQAGVCAEVIAAQGKWRRAPEGWTGRLREAPILFVTSNPNTNIETPGSDPVFQTKEDLARFNDLYFDSHAVSGAETWTQMRKWATTLRGGRDTIAGRDFALTDAVRCASPKQAGVEAALGRCAGRYLGKVLALSDARVIAFCGVARKALSEFVEPERYRVNLAVNEVTDPVEFFGRERILIGLKHPADVYHGDRDLTALGKVKLSALVSWLE